MMMNNERGQRPQIILRRGYRSLLMPGHPRADSTGRVYEHIVIAEMALGHAIRRGIEVHHANEDRSDNRPENLVVCQDHAYHHLLHRRRRALEACGHANWRPCNVCGDYDAPENMRNTSTREAQWYHPACMREHTKKYRPDKNVARRAKSARNRAARKIA